MKSQLAAAPSPADSVSVRDEVFTSGTAQSLGTERFPVRQFRANRIIDVSVINTRNCAGDNAHLVQSTLIPGEDKTSPTRSMLICCNWVKVTGDDPSPSSADNEM